MAKFVREIMNPELFAVEPHSPRDDALDMLLALGISACPVIDEASKILGMVSLRDLMSPQGGNVVQDRIREPAVTVRFDATVEEAAKLLSDHHVHQLVAVDDKGRAGGLVSAVDLVAALVGRPVAHPVAFPHVDAVARLSWSNDEPLDSEHTGNAPSKPGVLVLIYGGAGRREIPVWVESTTDLRARVDDLVSNPQDESQLAHILERDRMHLRYRMAVVDDAKARDHAVTVLRAHTRRSQRLG